MDTTRYARRGVSSSKEEVHAAVQRLDPGLFPGAFCKIIPDIFVEDPDHCMVMHADGAGTKSALAYLEWKKGKDLEAFHGLIHDSLFMNLDDTGCVGALGPFAVTLILNRNKHLVPGEVIQDLIAMCSETCYHLTHLGIPCVFAGGETADVPDLVRTITVDNVIMTRMRRDQVIDASRITPGSLIVGFSSTGMANWEEVSNSGMGSNGLTSARHDVLGPFYRKYPETYSPETDASLIYCGKHTLNDALPGDGLFTVGRALLSPTRTYMPLIKRLSEHEEFRKIQALIHCSGGGQTKIGKFGPLGVRYVKDSLLLVPPLFRFLREVQNLLWHEMYTTYGMGHRLEAVVPDVDTARWCIQVSQSCGIDAQVIGRVEVGDDLSRREVAVTDPEGQVHRYFFS